MENLIGNKYGSLTVIEFGYVSNDGKKYFWKCKCECGKERLAPSSWFKTNKPSGCSRKCPNWKQKPRNNPPIISKNVFYEENGVMIGLTTRNEKFYFDIEDYDEVSKHTWSFGKGYFITVINGKHIPLHHFIMGIGNEQIIDHRDTHPENCCKYNLRSCTHKENTRNCSIPKNNTSGFKGVTWHKNGKKWRSFIKVDYKQIHLGLYDSKIEAARKYNEAALKYFGEFALLNQIEGKAS
jgi:hypothetical protein